MPLILQPIGFFLLTFFTVAQLFATWVLYLPPVPFHHLAAGRRQERQNTRIHQVLSTQTTADSNSLNPTSEIQNDTLYIFLYCSRAFFLPRCLKELRIHVTIQHVSLPSLWIPPGRSPRQSSQSRMM